LGIYYSTVNHDCLVGINSVPAPPNHTALLDKFVCPFILEYNYHSW
jgi:hypothetical protein